jgi:hypothetical protein
VRNDETKLDKLVRLVGELVDAVANRPVTDGPRRLLSRVAGSAYLGISARQLDYCRAQGEVPAVVIGGRVLFDVVDLDAFIERRKERGGPGHVD